MGSRPTTALSFFSHVDLGDAFQFVDHTALRGDKKLQVGRGSPIYETHRLRRRVKKRKSWRGANPRPVGLNASAFPLPHSDLQCFVKFINNIMAERIQNSGVGERRWRSNPQVAGSRPASSFSFSDIFINHIPVVKYNSYYRREEIKYNRSEWRRGKALECQYNFKAEIGVQFINHIIAERTKKQQVGVV